MFFEAEGVSFERSWTRSKCLPSAFRVASEWLRCGFLSAGAVAFLAFIVLMGVGDCFREASLTLLGRSFLKLLESEWKLRSFGGRERTRPCLREFLWWEKASEALPS